MKFTNINTDNFSAFGDLESGEYFRIGSDFYIRIDIDDEDGDYYAINLETGEGVTIPPNTEVILINIKEIVYENV